MRARAGLLSLLLIGCSTPAPTPAPDKSPLSPATEAAQPQATICPERKAAPNPLPNVTPAQRSAAYWLEKVAAYGPLDEPLMSPGLIRARNAAFRSPVGERPYAVYDLEGPVDVPALEGELTERFEWLAARFSTGKYVARDGTPTRLDPAHARAALAGERLNAQLRVALALTQVHCAPTTRSFFTPSLDLRFDRNHCSSLHPQEAVHVLAEWPGGMKLVRTRYTYGWIKADAPLSPPVPAERIAGYVHGPYALLTTARDGLPRDTALPLGDAGATIASAQGFRDVPADGMQSSVRPLTRRAVVEEAFKHLDKPYGWGGAAGGQDCSRFLMDVFQSFGIQLPRHSGSQAKAGEFLLDVSAMKDEGERLRVIEEANRRGIVLLHFPGHIMLYLGKDEAGRPMAIHAFAEYVEPCSAKDPVRPDGTETLFTVDRISVSDLQLGRGSSRTAFIERLTKITVFGPGPGEGLVGVAQVRPAAAPTAEACEIADGYEIFTSPRSPNAQQPLRVMLTSVGDPRPGTLMLEAPSGERLTPPVKHYGLGPHAVVAQIETPEVGKWRVLYGDGERVHACRRVNVGHRAPRRRSTSDMAWTPRLQWGEDTENLYAAFIEALFDYPLDEDVSWKNLHTILQEPARNLLYGHFSMDEEAKLRMQPDCADLPYFLRAYFAWKLGLPYAYRQCNRGRAGRPPSCLEINASSMERPAGKDDVEAFAWFVNRKVRNGVHSASGRTHPDDDETDFYPVPLDRKWIRPGTLYADPYGHLLIVVDWQPQPLNGYGVLTAADGQPDGTVGRRRFWRGSFLFDPSTKDVGAGFKAFRPVVWQRKEASAITLANNQLRSRKGFAPFSHQQYQGSADDFYDGMERLINPRPLDPVAMQLALVDAFEESVRRRVTSVNNGVQWVKDHPRKTIEMPRGYSIFETAGPWEDYSTPSRDLRLLISMDTVFKFVDRVRRDPGRFGIEAGAVDASLAHLEAERDAALSARTIEYTGSAGATHTLTLKQVLDRRLDFEMAYNPNDCIEIRWAAPEGSEERAACRKRAPAAQTQRMKKYRSWFADRRRPPR